MMWYTTFSICGKLIGHFPVCGWLRTTTGMSKRWVNTVTKGWDDPINDVPHKQIVTEVLKKCFVMILLEVTGAWPKKNWTHGLIQVPCQPVWCWRDMVPFWLHRGNDAQHINLAELDAMQKGLNLALQWQSRIVHLHTDSLCVYH